MSGVYLHKPERQVAKVPLIPLLEDRAEGVNNLDTIIRKRYVLRPEPYYNGADSPPNELYLCSS